MRNKYTSISVMMFLVLTFILSLFGCIPSIQAQDPLPPAPTSGYVVDQLGWFNTDQLAQINKIIEKLKNDTTNEIGLATINDCGEDAKQYRNDLFRNWGTGQKDKKNGLLILICWYDGAKDKRTLEQEVGYGLEGKLPDLLTSKVAKQYFFPAFSQDKLPQQVISSGQAANALIAMVKDYDQILRGSTPQKASLLNQVDAAIVAFLTTEILGIPVWVILLIILIMLGPAIESSISGGYLGGSSYRGSWGGTPGDSDSGGGGPRGGS